MMNWIRVADHIGINMPGHPNARHPNGQVERDVERLETSFSPLIYCARGERERERDRVLKLGYFCIEIPIITVLLSNK